MDDQRRLRASDGDRDQVLIALQEAHAAGRLTVAELDERQDRTIAARYVDELEPLVADLPEGAGVLVPVAGARSMATPRARASSDVATGPESMQLFAMLSGKTLRPARGLRRLNAGYFLGGDTIDLSDCLGPGVTVTFHANAMLGGATIRVPRGVRVLDNSFNLMAGNSVKNKANGDGSNGTLVLEGFSFMGGHDVKLAPSADEE